jgi:beta-glucosidase
MENIETQIAQLTLQEKVSLLSGANYWNTKAIHRVGIPSIILTDGPHGLRRQMGKADHLGISNSVPATCFPTAAALANSWDVELLEKVGASIGAEAAATGVSVVLGPGLNIVRDPLAGRAFEYFSEDPYVSGKLAAALVNGLQSRGVAATPKHFAVNSQEHMRMSIDEVVDERTMREIYLEGFRRVIKESHPKLLMTSYNKVNGIYSNENTHLIHDILRDEWNYDGAIVTDWGGNNDRVAGLKAGSTLEMPSTNGASDGDVLKAVKDGSLDESVIDEQIRALLKLVYTTLEGIAGAPAVDFTAHHQYAVDAARQSIVLLKNDNNTLPLKSGTKVAVIGDFAGTPRYQGAGSSLVNPTQLVSALEVFKKEDSISLVGYEMGFHRTGKASSTLAQRAADLATKADVALIFVGLDEVKEAEGIDRKSMQLPANQLALIEKIKAVQPNVVVITAAGGALELPFADSVSALVHGSLGGQGIGQAVVDVIVGRHNPSGKLAVSYPYIYSDAPTSHYFPGKEASAEHREGLYVGYRYYETADVAVRYPFGYGLSYTSFSYSSVSATESGVTFSVTNDGSVAGAEITQVYIRPPESTVFRPTRELKGFSKVFLNPGETKQVTVHFDEHTFAHYNSNAGDWLIAGGEYVVEVGASVRDIRLLANVRLAGVAITSNSDNSLLGPYYSGRVKGVSDDSFEALLGRPLPRALWDRKSKVTYNDTVGQLAYGSIRGRVMYGLLRAVRKMLLLIGKPNAANTFVFILNLPFSKIPGFAAGKITKKGISRLFGLK